MHYRNTLKHCQTLKIIKIYQSYKDASGTVGASSFRMDFKHYQNGVLQSGLLSVAIDAREFVLYLKQLNQQAGAFQSVINAVSQEIEYSEI